MEQLVLDRLEKDKPCIETISVEYSQDADCMQSDDECQVLKFETCSNGSSSFYRMSMPQGGYWSFSSEDELLDIFRDFRSRFVQEEN